jgi:hypothetical protein
LKNPYDHHPFEKGFEEWRLRHAAYAAKEAAEFLDGRRPPLLAQAWGNPVTRRQWLKHASAGLPARSWLLWAYLMFVRRGVLDGPAGWEYCRRRRLYEVMINDRLRAAKVSASPAT